MFIPTFQVRIRNKNSWLYHIQSWRIWFMSNLPLNQKAHNQSNIWLDIKENKSPLSKPASNILIKSYSIWSSSSKWNLFQTYLIYDNSFGHNLDRIMKGLKSKQILNNIWRESKPNSCNTHARMSHNMFKTSCSTSFL